MSLRLLTEPHTHHGILMRQIGRAVDTILPLPKTIVLIKGDQ
ncbi:hypothetical protein ACKWMY_24230 [Serratia sp. J2]